MRPSILPNLIDAARAQRGARPGRSGAVRGRPAIQGRDADGPAHGRRRHPPQHGGAAQLGGPGPPRRRLRCQGRCAGRARRHRRAGRQHVGPAGRAGLVSPRPLGRDQARRPRDGAFRRAASARSSPAPISRGRSPPSRSSSTRRRCPRPRRPRPGRSSCCRRSSRSSATSPSSSMPTSRPRSWCAPRATPTRRWSPGARVFDVYAGKGVPDGKKSHRHRRHPAAGRAHADRRGDRGGESPRSWRRWPRQPALCCVVRMALIVFRSREASRLARVHERAGRSRSK